MIWPAVAILGFVTLQRLAELQLSNANTKKLLAAGGREFAPGHYPLIVAVHASWLAALWWFAPGRPVDLPLLVLFLLLQAGRVWVIRTLGPRWTTRIIVLPGTPLVTRGPFRWVDHPNYLVVIGEIAVLPLMFDLLWLAAVFTALNAVVLWVRIRAEVAALANARPAD